MKKLFSTGFLFLSLLSYDLYGCSCLPSVAMCKSLQSVPCGNSLVLSGEVNEVVNGRSKFEIREALSGVFNNDYVWIGGGDCNICDEPVGLGKFIIMPISYNEQTNTVILSCCIQSKIEIDDNDVLIDDFKNKLLERQLPYLEARQELLQDCICKDSFESIISSSIHLSSSIVEEDIRFTRSNFTGKINYALYSIDGRRHYHGIAGDNNILSMTGKAKGLYILSFDNGVNSHSMTLFKS